jgi:hypothetical protein
MGEETVKHETQGFLQLLVLISQQLSQEITLRIVSNVTLGV